MSRIEEHPILTIEPRRDIPFTFDGKRYLAKEGEVISSALLAQGISILGRHHKDAAPQGIFCANGQCAQCMVMADGYPVKACLTVVKPGMSVEPCRGMPAIPADDGIPQMTDVPLIKIPVLIIGGGPAGLSGAIELAKAGVRCLIVDDKQRLGGKLTLQTHNFFGSRGDCYAGTRGTNIALLLEEELRTFGTELVQTWLSSPAVAIFSDGKVGIVKQGRYVLVEPEILLVACGAREKSLAFPGWDLPGVFGAGAFQTLVNRDFVRPAERLFICGGGNVGLIAAYHALQAGVAVVGLVEALPECGGYKVHLDKLLRLGVPVYNSHTVLRAEGQEHLERVVVGRIDDDFRPVPGDEKIFEVDTLLVAVGLAPLNELYKKARKYGLRAFAAGDAEQIAEASAAMFSGRIQGRRILKALDRPTILPREWEPLLDTLRGKPGRKQDRSPHILPGKIYPIIRCLQEIPCNPCTELCPRLAIRIEGGKLTGWPFFEGEQCLGCARCVSACPGLAIVLVDESYDPGRDRALLILPFELSDGMLRPGSQVITVGPAGEPVGRGTVVATRDAPSQDHRRLILLEVPFADRLGVAGFSSGEPQKAAPAAVSAEDREAIICRCERVTRGEIVDLIQGGYRDINQLKAALRVGMGACGGKTCQDLILRLFQEEGVNLGEVTPLVERPLEMEIPLRVFAGAVDVETGE
ncbi:MAG: FAD-dependent oxidoreductase [Spirochaetaceae bacterium]|nr:MAG: FAD-dependent oxidoreductase [Spirochaetaceae bacterium]